MYGLDRVSGKLLTFLHMLLTFGKTNQLLGLTFPVCNWKLMFMCVKGLARNYGCNLPSYYEARAIVFMGFFSPSLSPLFWELAQDWQVKLMNLNLGWPKTEGNDLKKGHPQHIHEGGHSPDILDRVREKQG